MFEVGSETAHREDFVPLAGGKKRGETSTTTFPKFTIAKICFFFIRYHFTTHHSFG